MSRSSIVLTGLIGLIGAGLLTAVSILLVLRVWLPVLLTRPLYVWGLFVFLLLFSLAEIPVMILGIRHIAGSVNPKAKYVVLLVNTSYPLFAAVYAVPFILLTGKLIPGVALAALGLLRFVTAIIFLPNKPNNLSSDPAAPQW